MIIDLTIPKQPNDESCGVASLLGLYKFFGHEMEFNALLNEVHMLNTGGTISVNLGLHALDLGFKVEIFSYNLHIFDPSWSGLPKNQLIRKLKLQMKAKSHETKLCEASERYILYLEKGGAIIQGEMTKERIKSYVDQSLPMIVALSSTHLYQSQREDPLTTDWDDIGGYPAGHFVVLNGYTPEISGFSLCDPYPNDPFTQGGKSYIVDAHHFFASVYLSVVTYDANFLVLTPQK